MKDDSINTRTAKKCIDLQTTVCKNGKINVRNPVSGSGDVHTVHLDDTGNVDRCTCKGWTHYQNCYHTDAIRANGQLRSAARACTDRQSVMTDGGETREANMTCRNDKCGRRYHYVDEGPECPDCGAWGEQDPEPEGMDAL